MDNRSKVEGAEIALAIHTTKPLTVPELYRVRKAVNAVLNRPVSARVYCEHYYDDGTKSYLTTPDGRRLTR